MASKCVALVAVSERDLTLVKVMAKGLGLLFGLALYMIHQDKGLGCTLII